ncbi:MAG: efflux RND transporter periplasmic adaptor subunit [Bacteroidota bacterium]|nr:efflux RND transporter periplasmic adaptor subunit [Bacteroidota bacterium]
MKKNIIKILSIITLSSLFATSCSDKKTENQGEQASKVQVETAVMQELDQVYDFTSTVEAKYKNYISSAGGTRIEKIYVEVGDRVTKGQTLVKMENTSVATAQTQLDNLGVELARVKALYQSGGASKQQVDQAQVQYDVAKKNIQNLKENITLTSPINGVVTLRNFDNGDVAGTSPILQVMQISPVKLKFSVNESLYSKVKLGMQVTAKVEVFGEEEFKGKISLISPTIDPDSRTFYVEAEFTNANQRLRPGMFGRAELNLGRANTIVVSDKAVIKQNGTNDKYIFIVTANNTLEYRKISVGKRLGDKYAILEGVNEGEKVVVSDHNKLKNGAKVVIVK